MLGQSKEDVNDIILNGFVKCQEQITSTPTHHPPVQRTQHMASPDIHKPNNTQKQGWILFTSSVDIKEGAA